ncbi:MAG: hypothetical protein LBJ36_01330 [Synergistaceae bacterium]|jgi:hypothetical protein|nr:hypothetical protein [Synergistaceae bacterium]
MGKLNLGKKLSAARELCHLEKIPIRVVVTGSRGKSALTRLLRQGFSACGLSVYARITGVVPRELSPLGERVIRRRSPAHIRETRWWLSQVPADANALVVENSAVAPELQSFASDLIHPTLVVWTTLRADHVEAWGPGREGAARTLFRGVPPGVPVAGGAELARSPLPRLFEENGNPLYLVPDIVPDIVTRPGKAEETGHKKENLALAELAYSLCGVDAPQISTLRSEAMAAMASLPPDLADFRILREGQRQRQRERQDVGQDDELAVAFSANDLESTRNLFAETGWSFEETTLLYHHRPDRGARLGEFLSWIRECPWRDVVFTRARQPRIFSPLFSPLFSLLRRDSMFRGSMFCNPTLRNPIWNDAIDDPASFRAWRGGRGRVFACGNVAGWPLEFLKEIASSFTN